MEICPECGYDISHHDGWGGPMGCSLTDNGVARRVWDAKKHFYAINIDWDDLGNMVSWDVKECHCDSPWHHAHGL